MKRTRVRKSMGISKKRRTKKPRSLMKRVDTKIARAINKSVEYKMKSLANAQLNIVPLATAASQNLPILNYINLSTNWPAQGAGTQETRIGNTMKKVTTYFTLEFQLLQNLGTTIGSQIPSIGYRIILFTCHETIDTALPITQFFQFNTNTAGLTTMINPTNKARIVVLYDKVFQTPMNPNVGIAVAANNINVRKIIRYSRKFKEITFAVNTDTTPQKPTAYTYCAVFSDGAYNSVATVGSLHYVHRYYWVD